MDNDEGILIWLEVSLPSWSWTVGKKTWLLHSQDVRVTGTVRFLKEMEYWYWYCLTLCAILSQGYNVVYNGMKTVNIVLENRLGKLYHCHFKNSSTWQHYRRERWSQHCGFGGVDFLKLCFVWMKQDRSSLDFWHWNFLFKCLCGMPKSIDTTLIGGKDGFQMQRLSNMLVGNYTSNVH